MGVSAQLAGGIQDEVGLSKGEQYRKTRIKKPLFVRQLPRDQNVLRSGGLLVGRICRKWRLDLLFATFDRVLKVGSDYRRFVDCSFETALAPATCQLIVSSFLQLLYQPTRRFFKSS